MTQETRQRFCSDCGRAIGWGHARSCRNPEAETDRLDVAPKWLSPASYRETTAAMEQRLGRTVR